MAVIEVLPDVVANQIAAGEVVNRPASVVKELMENAIDAGATQITLIITDAGKTLIQVTDNGCGMDKDDAAKCFLPHATSKISSADDLFALNTMGFRGEALASISAISFVELKTKRKQDKDVGTLVCIEGGQIKRIEQAMCENGTSISVKNIFFNTPARRNFLKSDSIECKHIMEEFMRIALFHNNVCFSYYNNEKLIFKLDKSIVRKRICDIFGKNYNEKIYTIEEDTDLVKISGFISKPNLVRKSKEEQYFFVNGRFMKNHYFANAISRAYIGLIADKTYPFFIVFLNVNPKNIDVNIHPTKTEIKFLDEKFIYSILYAAAKRCLGQFSLATEIDWDLPTTIEFSPKPSNTPPKQPTLNYNPNYNPFNANFDKSSAKPVELNLDLPSAVDFVDSNSTKPYQLAKKYIIVPSKDSFVVINQQKASFKVHYDELISTSNSVKKSQQLLFAYNHFFNPAHSFRLLELSKELSNYGFELDYKADGSFDIKAAPSNLNSEQSVEAIEEYLNNMDDTNNDFAQRRHKITVAIAKRLCIKEGDTLSEEQIDVLLSRLYATSNNDLTSLNERIKVKVSVEDLDKIMH